MQQTTDFCNTRLFFGLFPDAVAELAELSEFFCNNLRDRR